jgi:lipopolysaccharide export system permease protein
MVRILPRYIRKRFFGFFFFSVVSAVLVFLVIDLVQDLDRFIDRKVPQSIVWLYYVYYLPYLTVLTMPVASLMATVFSVGSFARQNEMVALKSLGYSYGMVMRTYVAAGLAVSLFAFGLSEGLAVHTTRKKEEIRRTYMEGIRPQFRYMPDRVEIQEPPNRLVTIGNFDVQKKIAYRVKIETVERNRLVSRVDAVSMTWDGTFWIVREGYKRLFEGEDETATPIQEVIKFRFGFDPEDIVRIQVKPDEMTIGELQKFMRRVRESGGEVYRWSTDFHLRIAFPLSNVIIVLLSVPLVYNRRKKSLTVGFGFSLTISFFYFGIVKLGQTIGQNGAVPPFFAAWMGNLIMVIFGFFETLMIRK